MKEFNNYHGHIPSITVCSNFQNRRKRNITTGHLLLGSKTVYLCNSRKGDHKFWNTTFTNKIIPSVEPKPLIRRKIINLPHSKLNYLKFKNSEQLTLRSVVIEGYILLTSTSNPSSSPYLHTLKILTTSSPSSAPSPPPFPPTSCLSLLMIPPCIPTSLILMAFLLLRSSYLNALPPCL